MTAGTVHHANIIKSSVFTEKSAVLLDQMSKYVFYVRPSCTKAEVKQLVEELYNVSVVSVNSMCVKGKKVVFKRRPGCRAMRKKVIVSLKRGMTINF